MADTRSLQIRTETRGAVPEGAVGFAVQRIRSLLHAASEPVLFARVELIMAADPAVERPATAKVSIDLNGRPSAPRRPAVYRPWEWWPRRFELVGDEVRRIRRGLRKERTVP